MIIEINKYINKQLPFNISRLSRIKIVKTYTIVMKFTNFICQLTSLLSNYEKFQSSFHYEE